MRGNMNMDVALNNFEPFYILNILVSKYERAVYDYVISNKIKGF